MSAPPKSRGEPITDKRQIVEWFEAGCKPKPRWRIGTEHEKFCFRLSDLRRLPYEGPDGIGALLKGLQRFGWSSVEEGGRVIALTLDDGAITLEPGGQFELSGAPVRTIHETCAEVHTHLHQVKEVAAELGIGLLGLGFDPKWRREDISWMPKARYRIMRDYMAKKGKLGHDMMLRTCTVQVNLDFASEADMVRKFRVSLALQPVATALFANSPFKEGKPNGFLSYRSHVWTDTDPDRTGILPFVFEPGMGFERYVDYLLDVPMYFFYRDDRYIDASGQSFRDFLKGKLPALPGEVAAIGDFVDHVTTVFPEVRLKRYLEMRGADGGPWRRICALPALWVGLLYDEEALAAAETLTSDWTYGEVRAMRDAVPAQGIAAPFRNTDLHAVGREVLALSRMGLKNRARNNRDGYDETHFLSTLEEVVARGSTTAEEMLNAYHTRWGGSIEPAFLE